MSLSSRRGLATRVRDEAAKTSEEVHGGLGGQSNRHNKVQLDGRHDRAVVRSLRDGTGVGDGYGDEQGAAARKRSEKDVELWCREISDVSGRTFEQPKDPRHRTNSSPGAPLDEWAQGVVSPGLGGYLEEFA